MLPLVSVKLLSRVSSSPFVHVIRDVTASSAFSAQTNLSTINACITKTLLFTDKLRFAVQPSSIQLSSISYARPIFKRSSSISKSQFCITPFNTSRFELMTLNIFKILSDAALLFYRKLKFSTKPNDATIGLVSACHVFLNLAEGIKFFRTFVSRMLVSNIR